MATQYEVAPGVWITRELAQQIAHTRVEHEGFSRAAHVIFETICVEGIALCIGLGDGNEEVENFCFSLWGDDEFRLRFLQRLRVLNWKGEQIVTLFKQCESNFTRFRFVLEQAHRFATIPTG